MLVNGMRLEVVLKFSFSLSVYNTVLTTHTAHLTIPREPVLPS